MIHQLVYLSFSSSPVTKNSIEEILKKAEVNNPKLDLTGILICNSNVFMQLLEGTKENIMKLMDKVEKDPRHDQVTIVHEGDVDERFFPDWSMAFRDINEFNKDFIEELIPYFAKEKAIENHDELIKLIENFSESFGHRKTA